MVTFDEQQKISNRIVGGAKRRMANAGSGEYQGSQQGYEGETPDQSTPLVLGMSCPFCKCESHRVKCEDDEFGKDEVYMCSKCGGRFCKDPFAK